MQRTSAGGVTLLTTPAPGPLTARLTFGCGARDETAPTMGVTRVIEALVRAEIGTPLHEFTTTVGTAETHFTATGTPPAVARFLHTVCRTLSDLPLHRTAHATRLLGMDGTRIPEHRAVEPLSARFGPHAAGLVLHHDNTMYESITPDMVRAHAATFFTRGNAVLALDGPTPDALALPLPDAPKPQRTTPRARTGASWQHRPVPTVSLLLTSGASSAAADAAHTILRRRVERSARDLQAVGNDVTAHRVPRDRLTLDRIIVLDVLEGRAEQAAESLWYEARHLATEGATETELHAFTTHARAAQDFTDSHWRTLERAVTAELFGTPFLDDRTLLETLKAVTPQDVRHAAQQALTDAVIVVPPQAFLRLRTPQGAALPPSDCWRTHGPATSGTVFPMPRLSRARTPRNERGEWVMTPWGLVCRDSTEDEHDIRFDQVALMVRDGDDRTVLTGCGCYLHVHPRYFKRGNRLTAALDAAVPAHLVRDAP